MSSSEFDSAVAVAMAYCEGIPVLSQFDEIPGRLLVDLIIVGAGVSGLYCTRRLLDHEPNIRVLVIERLSRTGGRLDSDQDQRVDCRSVGPSGGGLRFNHDSYYTLRDAFSTWPNALVTDLVMRFGDRLAVVLYSPVRARAICG